MTRTLVALALALAACSKSTPSAPDDCQRFVEKSAPALPRPLSDAGRADVLKQCRAGLAEGRRDPALDCVLKAQAPDAIKACFAKPAEDYKERAKRHEAKLKLDHIAHAAKAAYTEQSAFPKGSAPLTPATPCCQQPGGLCQANAADWQTPVWKAIDFQDQGTSIFQYSYESDGATFTAIAVGDPGCVGKPFTYTLSGSAPDGSPQTTIKEPSPAQMKR